MTTRVSALNTSNYSKLERLKNTKVQIVAL
ncbi:hypothetical protein ELOC111193_01195 [Elizabethkingia occulta]